jgi:hypothetical protein
MVDDGTSISKGSVYKISRNCVDVLICTSFSGIHIGCSVGIVPTWTQATEFFFFFIWGRVWCDFAIHPTKQQYQILYKSPYCN